MARGVWRFEQEIVPTFGVAGWLELRQKCRVCVPLTSFTALQSTVLPIVCEFMVTDLA